MAGHGASVLPERVGELCAGIPAADRERPFFFRSAGVEGVRQIVGEQANAKFAREELRGVEIIVRGGPDVTRYKVTRVMRCHAAWSEALGADVAGSFEDPLSVGLPKVSFEDGQTGTVIRIEGHDRAQGEEILRRAEAMLDRGGEKTGSLAAAE